MRGQGVLRLLLETARPVRGQLCRVSSHETVMEEHTCAELLVVVAEHSVAVRSADGHRVAEKLTWAP